MPLRSRVFLTLLLTMVAFAVLVVALALHTPALPAVHASLANSIQTKLQAAKQATAVEARTVRLTEEEINSFLRERVQKYSQLAPPDVVGLRDMRVRLVNDRVVAYMVLTRSGYFGHKGRGVLQ